MVKQDDYHVFLTEYSDLGGLYVANQTATGFEVRSRTATAAGTFSYRVMARRKDVAGPRLEKVEVPDVSKVKEPPKPPDLPRGDDDPRPRR